MLKSKNFDKHSGSTHDLVNCKIVQKRIKCPFSSLKQTHQEIHQTNFFFFFYHILSKRFQQEMKCIVTPRFQVRY